MMYTGNIWHLISTPNNSLFILLVLLLPFPLNLYVLNVLPRVYLFDNLVGLSHNLSSYEAAYLIPADNSNINDMYKVGH